MICAAGMLLTVTSCKKDFDKINSNPNSPASVPNSTLLTGAEKGLMDFTWDRWWNGTTGMLLSQYYAENQYTDESLYQFRNTTIKEYWTDFYAGGIPDQYSQSTITFPLGGLKELQTIIDQQSARGDQVIALRGNHEQAMLAFLDDPAFGPKWIAHGGRDTLMSYGVAPPAAPGRPRVWAMTRAALAGAMPPEHHNLLNSLQLFATIGDYVFVHAGVRPGVPMEQQSAEDLLWIRDDFLITERAIEQTVVHGHTPAPEPVFGDGRIGVDTGAYGTGVLTAAKLIGDKVDILRVSLR